MPLVQTLYPYALAAMNMAIGWLLVVGIDAILGVLLVAQGVLVLLAVLLDRFQPPTASTHPVPSTNEPTR